MTTGPMTLSEVIMVLEREARWANTDDLPKTAAALRAAAAVLSRLNDNALAATFGMALTDEGRTMVQIAIAAYRDRVVKGGM